MKGIVIFLFGMFLGIVTQRIAGKHVDTLIQKAQAATVAFVETKRE